MDEKLESLNGMMDGVIYHNNNIRRNLLYTAVTRARELAVIVGSTETMHRMVDNNRVTDRYTALARRLKDMQACFRCS